MLRTRGNLTDYAMTLTNYYWYILNIPSIHVSKLELEAHLTSKHLNSSKRGEGIY
jgi:hypothetical protein